MIKLIGVSADLGVPQIIEHHFIAGSDSELRNTAGPDWCSQCVILSAELDQARFTVDQSECTETAKVLEHAVLTEAWVQNCAQQMCRLAEMSGTIYAGWQWLGPVAAQAAA